MLQIFPQYYKTFHVFMRTEIVPGKKCGVTAHASFFSKHNANKGMPGDVECLTCFEYGLT